MYQNIAAANMTTEERFRAAVNIIRSLPKDGPYQPAHDMMLKFYGLYKQALEGPCSEPKPAFYEVVKGYKWRAWSNLGDMTQDQAKEAYVDELKKIIETMAYTENVANFMDVLGPFYEFIEVPGKKKLNNNTKGLPDENHLSEHEGNVNGNDMMALVNVNGRPQTNGRLSELSESASDEASFPQPPSSTHSRDMEMSLAEELSEAEGGARYEEEEEDEDDVSEEVVVVEVTTHESGFVDHQVHNIYSDSDSDEEYSEPAESPDHLVTTVGDCTMEPEMVPLSDPSHIIHLTHNTQTSLADPSTLTAYEVCDSEGGKEGGSVVVVPGVTCGGGDQSHPGGLQMTPRQAGQASKYHGVRGKSTPDSLATPGRRISPGFGGGGDGGGGSGGDGGGGTGGDGGGDSSGGVRDDVNAQLVLVLQRLQTDMESVLHRLNTLETLTLTQHHSLCHHCQSGSGSGVVGDTSSRTERSWWPFPELSPRSTFFLLLWPFILHGGLKLLPLIRFRRKRS